MFKGLSWNRKTFSPDLIAGLTVALVSIPEGMTYALDAQDMIQSIETTGIP